MKKVVVFVGTATKMHTFSAVRQFVEDLQSFGDVECEVLVLSHYRLGTCRGCQLCFARGEEACPMKDDRDVLIEKMMTSDGVVFATPNYSFQVSALTKIFLDRLGFAFHRPRFFGKTFTSIIAQGIYGGQKIERYLNFIGQGLGFNTVKGAYFTAFRPMTEAARKKMNEAVGNLSRRFHQRLLQPAYPPPTFFKLMGFRMARTSMGLELDDSARDFLYYRDKGWFESDYYYPTHLGPLKKAAGRLFDRMGTRAAKKRLSSPAVPRKAAP